LFRLNRSRSGLKIYLVLHMQLDRA